MKTTSNNTNRNIFWERFKESDDRNEFLLNLVEDFMIIFQSNEPTHLIDADFHYPDLMKGVHFDEEEQLLTLDNIESDLAYEDVAVCYQSILNGPVMFLHEESLEQFFDLIFKVDVNHFIGDVENKLTPIEYDGINAKYYTETREDGIIFTGILFD